MAFAVLLTALVVGFIYFRTLAPSVVQIDSGELASVQSVLGIAHPTGYPLFTVAGNLFARLPLFSSVIRRLNFLAMLYTLSALVFFMLSAGRALSNDGRAIRFSPEVIAAVCGAGLFLGFSRTFWMQGASVEVYSLHLLLTGLTLWTVMPLLHEERPSMKRWMAVSFLLGLSFSNHMTTLFLIPGLAYVWITRMGFNQASFKKLALCALAAAATGCIVYLYLPVRAAQHPALNWGDPVQWDRFIRHVTGRQYSVWMFKSSEAAWANFSRFWDRFPSEFGWMGLAFGVIGTVSASFKSLRIFLFLAIAFITTVFYSVNYDIHDLDAYFLLAFSVFAVFIAFGIKGVLEILKKFKPKMAVVSAMVVLSAGFEARSHYKEADLSDCHAFEDYAKKSLASLPENAVLITYQWDYLVSPACYFQQVEWVRPDVAVVDKELLRRSWYFRQLETNFPEIIHKIRPEISAFLDAVKPFEEGGAFNSALLDRLYSRLIMRLMETNIETGVFLGPELIDKELQTGEVVLPDGCALVPDLFFYRLVRAGTAYVPLRTEDNGIRFPKTPNAYTENVKRFAARMAALRVLYETRNGKLDVANRLRQVSSFHYPEFPFPSVFQ
jgi:hypothetical protein